MFNRILNAFRGTDRPPPAVPDGVRVHAIGDVHGRLDLLDRLLERIDEEDCAAGSRSTLIFLGDLVDRGPDSAGVIDRIIDLAAQRPDTRALMGNHEEVFLTALGGNEEAVKLFCRIGGRETLESYGLGPDEYDRLDFAEVGDAMRALVPEQHRALLSAMEDMVVLGDYAFVHAGVRPGVPLEEQRPSDLRWIRGPFLESRAPADRIIVHGHSIRAEPDLLQCRIGIDTGAYATGRLTALGLEGSRRWLVETTTKTEKFAVVRHF